MSTYDVVLEALPALIELLDSGAVVGTTAGEWCCGDVTLRVRTACPVTELDSMHIRCWLVAILEGKAMSLLPAYALYLVLEKHVHAWITHNSKEMICAEN